MLESSVEHANGAILVTEAENMEEPGPRILYANRAFTRMTGHTEAEVLGKNPRMFQGPKTARSPGQKSALRSRSGYRSASNCSTTERMAASSGWS